MTTQTLQITQHELQELYELKREVAQKEKRVEDLESYIKTLLIAKTPIELGRFDASLVTRTVHHPAWKQAVIDKLGAEFADAFWRNSKTSRLCEVRIEEHAIPPLWKAAMEAGESNR